MENQRSFDLHKDEYFLNGHYYSISMTLPEKINKPENQKSFFKFPPKNDTFWVKIGGQQIDLYAGQSHINVAVSEKYYYYPDKTPEGDNTEKASLNSSEEKGGIEFGMHKDGSYVIRSGHHRLFFMLYQTQHEKIKPEEIKIKYYSQTFSPMKVKIQDLTYRTQMGSCGKSQ